MLGSSSFRNFDQCWNTVVLEKWRARNGMVYSSCDRRRTLGIQCRRYGVHCAPEMMTVNTKHDGDAAELDAIVDSLSAQYPSHTRAHVRNVVFGTYIRLMSNLRVADHVIDLTRDCSRELLADSGHPTELAVG